MAPFGAVQSISPHFSPQPQFHTQQQMYPSHVSPAFGPPQTVPVEADSERGNDHSRQLHSGHASSGIEAFLAKQGNADSSVGGGSESGMRVGTEGGTP